MADRVGRNKSYRWVSASQASYDGAGWESSSDEDGGSNPVSSGDGKNEEGLVSRQDTISKLPALPKLNYSDDEEDEENDHAHNIRALTDTNNGSEVDEGRQDPIVESSLTTGRSPRRVKPQAVNEQPWEAKLGIISSRNSSKSSLNVRRTPVNEDLENLMAQISKEMTPKNVQKERFSEEHESDTDRDRDTNSDVINNKPGGDYDTESDGSDRNNSVPGNGPINMSPNGKGKYASTEDFTSDNDEDFEVSKTGYFSSYIEHENDQENKEDQALQKSPDSPEEGNDVKLESSIKNMAKDENVLSLQEEKDGDLDVSSRSDSCPSEQPASDVPHASLERTLSKSGSFYEDDYSSDEDDKDDALSYTESIQYQGKDASSVDKITKSLVSQNENEDIYSLNDEERQTDEEHHISDNEDLQPSRSGYFNKMVDTDGEEDDDGTSTSDDHSRDSDDVDSIPYSSSTVDEEKNRGKQEAEAAAEAEKNTPIDSENGKNYQEDTDENNMKHDDEHVSSTRQSVNLGKWRPDTDAFRTGFVQETSKNVPPGFVLDENGKLVDLTPSSMKSRIASSYSEAESSWNAFPSEENGELETIRDTKTIYDNNTIHNVPGIITNNQNLPPLPDLAHRVASNDSSDDPRSFATGNSTGTTLDADGDRPLQTQFKEVFTVHEPDSREIARVAEHNKVPSLDLNKTLSSTNTHSYKLHQLEEFSKQLEDYDPGIQIWISYTLKSSSKSDGDYMFDEYKISKHVRDAYANADELSRKNTVINTVASVNQNVSHLTKKVFLRKSRGIFSSIGKKKI